MFSNRYLQFIRFCLVGGAGLLINLAVTYIGVEMLGLWYLSAFIIGLLVSWTCSFILNALLTFPEHERAAYHKKYMLFMGMYGTVFILNTALMYGLTSLLGVYYPISIVLCAASTLPLTYSFSKYVIYRP
jgi:putative flippase GtrA